MCSVLKEDDDDASGLYLYLVKLATIADLNRFLSDVLHRRETRPVAVALQRNRRRAPARSPGDSYPGIDWRGCSRSLPLCASSSRFDFGREANRRRKGYYSSSMCFSARPTSTINFFRASRSIDRARHIPSVSICPVNRTRRRSRSCFDEPGAKSTRYCRFIASPDLILFVPTDLINMSLFLFARKYASTTDILHFRRKSAEFMPATKSD